MKKLGKKNLNLILLRKSNTLKRLSQNVVFNLIRFFVDPSYSVGAHVVMACFVRSP